MNEEYFELLDLEYNKPPKDVVKSLKKTMKNTNSEIFTIKKDGEIIAGVTLIKLSENVFGIHELITKKDYRNKGFATKLMKQIHNKLRGIFIVRTTNARKFYEILGYKYIGNKTLVMINKQDLFNRKYWFKLKRVKNG